ncbi:homoserine dehydrogenase [Anatilimnocola sp. NA78]|uniref:homoserine dehydrogenase n=1 Tax=Anatilimnocola sp. NA78 TaxID=3415683 RepID=UPI003CE58136
MQVTKVALVGMGTVGAGVARLLIDHGDRTGRHAGRTLWVEEVVVADPTKARDFALPKTVTLSDDLTRITKNPEIKLVAHLVGGLEPARTIMLKLLESGKDVVTANKALLAEHGPEIFDRARELGRAIAFDAAVAGGIPIITNISQCFSANQILSLRGILNGTSNFIVSQMDEQGETYAEALKEAQARGYAEADPTMDVSGADAAQKLAILAHLAFGAQVHWNDIPRVGIDTLDAADLYYARELGYRIKLIAVAKLRENGLELHVTPNLVKIGTPLAEVRSAYNAISVVGDAVGPIFFHGLGAGQMPTASAVVADMIDMAVGRTPITFRTVELWSKGEARVQQCDHASLTSRFYIRLTVEDRPGVLAEVTGVLGRNQISIASVIQHEPSEEDGGQSIVPLVIMTAQATEGATQRAMTEIGKLSSVRPNAVRMRVLD